MKLYAGMAVYNMAPIAEVAVRSIYDIVERIFVIDGSVYGPSTDDTASRLAKVGSKVVVESGTFAGIHGQWDEVAQRQRYLDLMPRNDDDWCLVVDGDDVWSQENKRMLLDYLVNVPDGHKRLGWKNWHFWRRTDQIITGGCWDAHRMLGAVRLTETMRAMKPGCEVAEADGKILNAFIVPNLRVHHYGQALPFDRQRFRVQEYLIMGDARDKDGNLYRVECKNLAEALKHWERLYKRPAGSDVVPYEGPPHPPEVLPLIGVYLK